MNKIFAITTRGLESISADELASLPDVSVEQIAYRRVFATCTGNLRLLLHLRTVDDVFLYVDSLHGMGRPREALKLLKAASDRLPLQQVARICAQVRALPEIPTFSVTANFVGRRNYSTLEIKLACAEGITEAQGWTYSEDDRVANLNVRIFIEDESAVIGVRLGEHSLSKRAYKQDNVPGSLKPTVAAALVSLAGVRLGMRVLDPCCGAGTILIEAEAVQVEAWGGDIDLQIVRAAKNNAFYWSSESASAMLGCRHIAPYRSIHGARDYESSMGTSCAYEPIAERSL